MLSDVYNSYITSLDRIFDHDRTKSVGASEIGSCSRQTFWVKNKDTKKGAEIDPDYVHDWGARIRGTLMEKVFWEPALRAKYGDKLLFAGKDQRTFQVGRLSATPDGLLIDQPYDSLKEFGIKDCKGQFMIEGKTVDPRTSLVEAREAHIFQAQTQLGLVRELTPYKPVYSLITYTDASFWSEVDEFVIQFDPVLYERAKQRADNIMTARHGKDLKPEGWIGGGKQCQFCAYVKACGVIRRGVPYGTKQASPQVVAEVTDLAKEANSISIKMKKEADKLRDLQDDIKGVLRSKGVRRIPNVVNWYSVAAPTKYHNKELRNAFVELGGDLEEFTYEGPETDRLVIAATPAASRVVRRRPARKVKPETGKLKRGKSNVRSNKRTAAKQPKRSAR
jgi:hypothetical protein